MDEKVYIIIAKELAGEATESERRELEAWLSSAEANRQDYEAMKMLWQQSDEVLAAPQFNTTAAWQKVAGQIATKAPAQKGRTIAMPVWVKYAAGVAAVLLVAVLVWKPLAGNDMVVVVADNGNIELTLPDNSHITLKEGSKISYPETFAKAERHVALEGEAFFEVTRNEKQPFVIDANAVNVKVLGTSFNVQCSAQDASVTVATGKVQVTKADDAGKYVILTPGEKAVLQHNELAEENVSDENYLYWKNGILSFDNKPLRYVIAEMARVQKVNITLDDAMPEVLKEQMITISFSRQPVEDMLTELCLVAKCRWARDANGYIITAK
jgi:transmembrane sensor